VALLVLPFGRLSAPLMRSPNFADVANEAHATSRGCRLLFLSIALEATSAATLLRAPRAVETSIMQLKVAQPTAPIGLNDTMSQFIQKNIEAIEDDKRLRRKVNTAEKLVKALQKNVTDLDNARKQISRLRSQLRELSDETQAVAELEDDHKRLAEMTLSLHNVTSLAALDANTIRMMRLKVKDRDQVIAAKTKERDATLSRGAHWRAVSYSKIESLSACIRRLSGKVTLDESALSEKEAEVSSLKREVRLLSRRASIDQWQQEAKLEEEENIVKSAMAAALKANREQDAARVSLANIKSDFSQLQGKYTQIRASVSLANVKLPRDK